MHELHSIYKPQAFTTQVYRSGYEVQFTVKRICFAVSALIYFYLVLHKLGPYCICLIGCCSIVFSSVCFMVHIHDNSHLHFVAISGSENHTGKKPRPSTNGEGVEKMNIEGGSYDRNAYPWGIGYLSASLRTVENMKEKRSFIRIAGLNPYMYKEVFMINLAYRNQFHSLEEKVSLKVSLLKDMIKALRILEPMQKFALGITDFEYCFGDIRFKELTELECYLEHLVEKEEDCMQQKLSLVLRTTIADIVLLDIIFQIDEGIRVGLHTGFAVVPGLDLEETDIALSLIGAYQSAIVGSPKVVIQKGIPSEAPCILVDVSSGYLVNIECAELLQFESSNPTRLCIPLMVMTLSAIIQGCSEKKRRKK